MCFHSGFWPPYAFSPFKECFFLSSSIPFAQSFGPNSSFEMNDPIPALPPFSTHSRHPKWMTCPPHCPSILQIFHPSSHFYSIQPLLIPLFQSPHLLFILRPFRPSLVRWLLAKTSFFLPFCPAPSRDQSDHPTNHYRYRGRMDQRPPRSTAQWSFHFL